MSSWSTPPRTAPHSFPLVVVLSLLSLSAVGCGAGVGADAPPRAGHGDDSVEENTAAPADTAARSDDGSGSQEDTAAGGDDGSGSNPSAPTPIVSCASGGADASDPYEIQTRSVEGDVLKLVVTHGGGCQQHDFRLCYERVFLETEPVQFNLRLDHDAHGDACRRLDRQVLEYELRPLRDYHRAAHPDSDTIILRLGGESITYEL